VAICIKVNGDEREVPDGTTIRALLRSRPPEMRQRRRAHAFDEAALLNEYSARILHFHMLLAATQGRVAQLEQELQRARQAAQGAVQGPSIVAA